MKKRLLLLLCSGLSAALFAQYTSGTFPVGSTGMTLKVDTTPTHVTITVTGPSNSYLGVGGSASGNGMDAGGDGFIYNSASTTDYTFNGVGVMPSPDAIQDWTILSNSISGTTRTVVAKRTLAGSAGDIPFPNAAGTIDLFCARGNGTLALSNHGPSNRDYVTFGMTFDPSLGTGEVERDKKPTVYPNPTNGMVHLNAAGEVKSISLYDTSGRKVLSPKAENNSIDISGLRTGSYFIEIEMTDGSKVYEKVLKQ